MEKHDDINIFTTDEMIERGKTELAIRELEQSASKPLASELDSDIHFQIKKIRELVLKGKVKKGPGKGRVYFRLHVPKSYFNLNRGKHRSIDFSHLTMKSEYVFHNPPVTADQQERLKRILIKARREDLGLDKPE